MYHRQENKCYPKGVRLPISKLHSMLAVVNLLAHNNISWICYCGQISLQSVARNCSSSDNLTPLGSNNYFAGDGTSILFETCKVKIIFTPYSNFSTLWLEWFQIKREKTLHPPVYIGIFSSSLYWILRRLLIIGINNWLYKSNSTCSLSLWCGVLNFQIENIDSYSFESYPWNAVII